MALAPRPATLLSLVLCVHVTQTTFLGARMPSRGAQQLFRPQACGRSRALRLQFGEQDETIDGAAAQQRWDDSSFADGGWAASEPLTVTSTRREPTKPIETVTVGVVSGPYKRRRGYHAEVMVQHAGQSASMHRLWFAHEVLQDVARLRNALEHHIDVEEFAEATVRFLQEQGVDLADPDWGLDDDSIPFSTEHLPLRTLFAHYPQLPEYLAEVTLPVVPTDPGDTPLDEAEDLARHTHELEPGVKFPCLGALAPDGSGELIGPVLEGEPIFVAPGTGPPPGAELPEDEEEVGEEAGIEVEEADVV